MDFNGFEFVTSVSSSVTSSYFEEILAFPNPTTGILTLTGIENIQSITIQTLLGRKIQSIINQENERNIDLTDLAKGIYLIQLTTYDNYSKTIKIITK